MATVGGVNSSGLSFTGLATGIDTGNIIDGLTKINQRRIDALKARQADIAARQSTFATLQGTLFDLRAKAAALARATAGGFDGRTAKGTDDAVLTAAAGSAAVPGSYTLTVLAQARAHTLASGAFADPSANIKTGTLTLRVGSGAAATVTIDGSNNTLQGLADAINNVAGGEVRAAVVNDGTATPYRLVLTAARTGAANAVAVTNDLTGGTGEAIDPAQATVQAAADAEVRLGSGPGALTVRSATNQVSGLIPGVTLDLKTVSAAAVTVTVAADTAAASAAVKGLADAYNAALGFIDDRDNYDPAAGGAGPFLGSREAAGLRADLQAALSAAVPGLAAGANRLASAGLSFDARGKLVFDAARLDRALAGQEPGIAPADIKRLFALTGTSSSPGVAFVGGTDKTRPSAAGPYQLTVTAAAARGTAAGSDPLAAATVVDASNNTFTVSVNGVTSAALTIPPATYTRAALATAVQTAINASPELQRAQVAVDVDAADKLRIASLSYGTGSRVQIGTGTAVGAGKPLGFAGTEAGVGADAAGFFTVGGQTEPATGSGQLLGGDAGNANTAGLQARVTLTAPGTADLTVTQGVAGRVGAALARFLDPTTGRLTAQDKQFQADIADIDKTIVKQNDLLEQKKNQLVIRFAAMERAVNNLKGLQSQLSSLIPTTTR